MVRHLTPNETARATRVGVVVIGRNEGERLRRCLSSLRGRAECLVYVDSGSTDGSVAAAESLGAIVHELDIATPFTAARARNAGWHRLLEAQPKVELVQFVDGDCEVVPGWIEAAQAFLRAREDVAAVAGRNRERFPERSIYNLLCDIEWGSGKAGSTAACGGNAMMRVTALKQSGGFLESLIAGEEPELCVRMRAQGWLIWRLDSEMTLHDAAMTRFGQWWKRAMRTGFSYAEGARLHGAAPERLWVREWRSAWVWAVVLPLLVVLLVVVDIRALWALLVYPLQVARLALLGEGRFKARLARAAFLVLGKFAEAAGQIRFLWGRLAGRRAHIIEYK